MHARSLRTVLGMTLAPLVGAAWLVAGASAQGAQEPPQQREQPAQPAQGSAITSTQVQDQELEAFVKSALQVNELRKSQSGAQDQQAKDQANQKLVSVIQACGMTPERFNELARAMSTDSQLNQRFQATQKELTDRHDLTCGSNNSGDKR